ncbi:hypothetical protein ACHAWT_009685 [Skeletonema menzelii]|mmetsp:Transcript_26439/g.43630  ORF Transcript_26439/g.43630 Transcript_26439/m.43630 type:complete len:431 (-) Transcript_26439:20-1312(-)
MRTATLSSIKRVVSVFILRTSSNTDEAQVALFRRCSQMPTFGGHWAAISGSIETHDVSPLAAAVREVGEETNLGEFLGDYEHLLMSGLHVDVARDKSKGTFGGRMIRVYPFALTLPQDSLSKIAMRGTEHDKMKFMTISDFLGMDFQCVPSLKRAFHHATSGKYLDLPQEIRDWEQDRVNGASYLARTAVDLAAAYTQNEDPLACELSTAQSIAILRPSMVPIVNAMNEFDRRITHYGYDKIGQVRNALLKSLTDEANRCVELGYELVMSMNKSKASSSEFVIGTFSRSSTLKSILQRVIESSSSDDAASKVRVVCSQSTPGDEGMLMANDISPASCIPDDEFQQQIVGGKIDVVIVGADCVLSEGSVVNKIGTAELASVCNNAAVPILSSADRWKLWPDAYCPPLEVIFELIPSDFFDHVLVPKDAEER